MRGFLSVHGAARSTSRRRLSIPSLATTNLDASTASIIDPIGCRRRRENGRLVGRLFGFFGLSLLFILQSGLRQAFVAFAGSYEAYSSAWSSPRREVADSSFGTRDFSPSWFAETIDTTRGARNTIVDMGGPTFIFASEMQRGDLSTCTGRTVSTSRLGRRLDGTQVSKRRLMRRRYG